MKIEIFPYRLQFKQPAGTSRGIYTTRDIYIVKIQHAGITGWGECAPLPDLSCDNLPSGEYLATLRRFAAQIEATSSFPQEDLRSYPSMMMGFESALRHIKARSWHHYPQTLFSQGVKGIPINGLVWMGSIDEMQQRLKQKLAEGYTCIKLKIGALDFDDEIRLVEQIRTVYCAADVEIRVDANGGFTAGDDCMYKLERLARLSVHSIEQPIRPHQLKELADICQRSPLPIALDEELIGINTLKAKRELLQYVKPDYIVLKPTLHGGFMGAEEWISEAEALGSKWWITSALESNIGLNALAQWTAYRMKDDYKMAQGLGTGHLFVHNFDNVPLTLQKGKLNTLTKQIHAI